MPSLITRRHGVRGRLGQAAYYNARERRKSLLDPAYELHGTHIYEIGDTIPNASLPSAWTDAITVGFTVRATGAGAAGLCFEIGGANAGFAMAISGTDLYVAGGGNAAGNDGATAMANNVIPIGATSRMVCAISPSHGLVCAWVNGKLVASEQSVSGTLSAWSTTEDGSFGAAPQGTTLDRIPVGLRQAPSNFELISNLHIYRSQRPRQMPEVDVALAPPSTAWTFDSTSVTFDSTTDTFDEV